MIQTHYNGIDFDVFVENIAGKTTVYTATPRIESIDPGIKTIVAVQDEDNYPLPEDEIDDDALYYLYYTTVENCFRALLKAKERGILDDLLSI